MQGRPAIIELEPGCDRPYYSRAVAYVKTGNYPAAITDFSRVIELGGGDARTYYDRGDAHYRLKQWDQAIADLTTAIELQPDFADAWQYRAVARRSAGTWLGASLTSPRRSLWIPRMPCSCGIAAGCSGAG